MSDPIKRTQRYLGMAAAIALLSACGGGGGDSAKSPVTDAFYPEPDAEWELVWSDEFDGDSLDSTIWEAQLGEGAEYGLTRWGNNEQQWYLAENATVSDGTLKITAKSEEVQPGFPYTSARLRTAGKFDFKYGRVEVRGKAAAGQGLWSAVWMLPTESPYGTWASSGEVDIMEVVNAGTESERVFTTVHHGFPWPLNQLSGLDVPVDGAADDFHTYALEWEEDELRWFIDGVHVKTVGAEHYYSYYYKDTMTGYESGPATAPFDTEFHLLVNLAVGGNLPGNVNAGDIPSEMEIDYIRVYNCSYNQADGGGCNSNADRTLERPDAQEPFEASFPMYTDAAEAFSWVVGGEEVVQQLAVNSFWNNEGALSFMESEVDGRGTVIEVMTSNMGNISINTTDGSTVTLFGFGNNPNFWEIHAGEIKFDMYIDSAGTDLDSSILIKMDSGYPALGFKELKVADLPKDEWFTYSVKVNDLLANSGEQPLDTSKVVSLFVLEPTSAAHVMVDNIELACGHPSRKGCGINPPGGEVDGALAPVLVNGEVNKALWDRGACGYDTTVNGDYCDDGNTSNLITWTVTDSGDPDIGNALLVNFGTNGANGVFFFGSAGGVDISEFEAEGKLLFDLRIPAATVAAGMVYKVDCFYPCGTGDQVLDLTGYEPGTWKTFEVSVSDLKSLGLDLTKVNAGIVLFPTWGNQQGLSFEVANVRYEVAGSEPPAGAGGTDYGPADFSGAFGGAFVDASETYTFPSGAEVWGGFANNNGDMYPMEFANGGKVTFTAAIPDGGVDTNVRFVFENAPYPDVDPNFSTANVLVSGGEATYEVEIPAQAEGQTFSSFLLYIVERDQPVIIKNVVVTANGAEPVLNLVDSDPADFSGAFGGAFVDASETYTFPSGAEGWAGFANNNADLYPFTFGQGGEVRFTASLPEGTPDTGVRFVFENAPYPDVDPNFSTATVTVSGTAEMEYSVEIPQQAAAQTYRSFLMYIVDRDQPVTIKNIRVATPQ